MKMTKKLITLALAALMLLSLAVPAMADDSVFYISPAGYLSEYVGPGGDIVIPDGVTVIGDMGAPICGPFTRGKVTGVTIPEGVLTINYDAFSKCENLARVSIPSSVTSIRSGAFSGCTSLTDITIPEGVTSIGGGAFEDCAGLKSITIPASVTTFGSFTFSRCTSLTDIYFGGTQAQWEAMQFTENGGPARIFDDPYSNSSTANPTIHYNSTGPEAPTEQPTPVPAASESAMPTNDRLTVDGALQTPTVYKIGGSNFFKIRDLAAMLNGSEKQFDVGYDGALASVTLTTGKGYAKLDTDMAGAATGGNQTAAPSNDSIYIDGQKIDVTVYKIGGNNYFKLRDLGKALGFYVGWTAADGMFIDTSKPYSD